MQQKADFPVEPLLPDAIARKTLELMTCKALKPASQTFVLAAQAGFFIGVAFVFYTLVTTGGGNAPYGLVKLAGGLCFSLGLMLVVVCGSDLFTSTTMTLIPRASGRITWPQMLGNWGVVYLGNLLGALLLVFIIFISGHWMEAHGLVGLNYLNIARHKLEHTFIEAVALGVMCNIMVCLGVWLACGGRSLADKLLAMILPVAMFVACGFEHCVANMYQIPMGILLYNVAPAEFWSQAGATASDYSALGIGNMVTKNLIPVTLGNIVGGGVFIGLVNWWLYLRHGDDKAH